MFLLYSLFVAVVYTVVLNVYQRVVLGLPPLVFIFTCLCAFTSRNPSASSVAFAARRLSFVSCCPSRQPGGDRVGGGLLGHAVVADHRVEATPWVGVLGGVVGLERSWDTPLVLRARRPVDLFCCHALTRQHNCCTSLHVPQWRK